jgi:hypothetical protein
MNDAIASPTIPSKGRKSGPNSMTKRRANGTRIHAQRGVSFSGGATAA